MKLLLVAAALLIAQEFNLDAPPPKHHQFVAYAAESAAIPAAKRTTLDLRFVVDPGYHVNSHKPLSELQIPTVLTLHPASGVRLSDLTYPTGKLFTFAFDPNEKLDVYQGNFIVSLPVTATPGPHEIKADLTYQACDHAACFPPKSLPITILFTAK